MANLRTTVILKTDIVDSTPRTAAHTHAEMGLQRKQHKKFLADIAGKHLGSILQEEGDGYLIEFPSVTSAALAAIDMHQNLRSIHIGKGGKERLAIRVVITVGDILHQENNTIGTTMSLTARIEKITPTDEIYLSHAAWLTLNKAEVPTEYVNEFHLKGFSEPEKIYRVLQKHRTRMLTDHYIVFSDPNRFRRFSHSASVAEIESFLLDCDDLINDICDRYGGMIRQIHGDQYFFTFTDAHQAITAIEELCHCWVRIVERYKLGISIGIHKGNLNLIRSFVYGEDIHTTVQLTELGKLYHPGPDKIQVIASRKIRNELQTTEWQGKFRELDPSHVLRPEHQRVLQEEGAFEFLADEELQRSLLYNARMDFKKTVKEGYNAIARRYLAQRTRDSEDVHLLNDFMKRLPASAKVLDAGCGAGIPISQRLSEHFQVTGVDFSEAQIELARRNVPNAQYLCEDLTKLDLPENTFDGITSYYAIIHIPREEHPLLLANFHKMLKPGGLALLCLGAEHLIDDIEENYLGARMYWSHYDAETYLQMLKNCGFVLLWSRHVADETCEGAGHLFVLAQK